MRQIKEETLEQLKPEEWRKIKAAERSISMQT